MVMQSIAFKLYDLLNFKLPLLLLLYIILPTIISWISNNINVKVYINDSFLCENMKGKSDIKMGRMATKGYANFFFLCMVCFFKVFVKYSLILLL